MRKTAFINRSIFYNELREYELGLIYAKKVTKRLAKPTAIDKQELKEKNALTFSVVK